MKKHSAVPEPLHNSTARIATLAFYHFMADLICGILPGILPVVMAYFNLDIALGVMIISCMTIGSNLMQIPASMLDRMHRGPRMLYLGLCMASAILFLDFFPRTTPFFVLCILMVIVGAGISIMHPLGLRGVQRIIDLPATMTTPAFMTGGFFGASVSPWISALLVESFGMKGLLLLVVPIVSLMLLIHYTNIKLAKDLPAGAKSTDHEDGKGLFVPWSFRNLFLIGMFLNLGTSLILYLIPSYLVELKFSLQFGGLSAMIFGLGSSSGSLMIGYLVRKRSCTPFILGGLVLGIPTTFAYFMLATHTWALILLFASGLLTSALFPIFVSLAKNAESKIALSTKMGLIVGGTWGIAALALLPIGQLAKQYGLTETMPLAYLFYTLALITAAVTLKRKKR